MKKYLSVLSALVLLFAFVACTPEDKNNGDGGGNQNNPDELTITGEALDITEYSATLTGYANLPLDMGDAEVGIVYDESQSFEEAKKVVATGLDGNNKYSVTVTGLLPGTIYYYKSYVQNGMAIKYGAMKSFTTLYTPVESVSLETTEHTFHSIGDTKSLIVTVLPADATDKSVEWSSDKEDVAAVNTEGVVTAKGNGKAIITVTTKDQGKKATCEITVAQWVTSMCLDKTSLSLEIGDEATLTVTSILPDNANDTSYSWSSSDNTIASVDNSGKITAKSKGITTVNVTANDGSGVFAACEVAVHKIDVPQVVDMGIVVNGKGIKWASFNLGASSPEDYGFYYAWGEAEPKSNYDWSTYKWCNGSSHTLTKYNMSSSFGTIDNKMELDPEDDVVHVKLGGNWRMPTEAEWTELRTQCAWTWTTQNGVNGRLVTASNGNSIFLPAAGSRGDTSLYGAGSSGSYWSSSLNTYYSIEAARLYFNSDDVGGRWISRYFGYPVRPVTE